MSKINFILIYSLVYTANARTPSAVPEQLVKCYNVDFQPKGPPFTQQTLVELIRKLEHNRTEPNLRLISNAILHTVKFDGIQHASIADGLNNNRVSLPYRASGPEFIKYQFLVDHLTPDVNPILPQVLNTEEFCTLHTMLSNSLDLRARNDERYTCPISISTHMNLVTARSSTSSTQMSECPEQKGVIRTDWGTIAPGYLIAGLASVLQPDRANLLEVLEEANYTTPEQLLSGEAQPVDNLWFATIGGVLAEAVINQARRDVRLESSGKWNDTMLPRRFFLKGDDWDANDAVLLGAIDGLILASNARKWYQTNPAATLSSIIDMYYSVDGVAYDTSVSACNRRQKLDELKQNNDFVKEVTAVTRTLNYVGSYPHKIRDEQIDYLAAAAVQTFYTTAATLIGKYDECKPTSGPNRLEIILITDHTYSPYELQRLLAVLAKDADISHHGGSVGLLAGSSANWLFNITHDLGAAFGELSNTTKMNTLWPTGLTLTRCLHEIISDYANRTLATCATYDRPFGRAIVILAQSSYLQDSDADTALRSMASLRNLAPDVQFVLVTSSENAKSYEQLVSADRKTMAISANDARATATAIGERLRAIPANIANAYCNPPRAEFEDYVTPGVDAGVLYEVDEVNLQATRDLDVKFQRKNYGELTVCAYNAATPTNLTCKHMPAATAADEVTFRVHDHCASSAASCSVRFAVTANNTAAKCTAFACRRADQVLMGISATWRNRAMVTSGSLMAAMAAALGAAMLAQRHF